MTKHMAWTMAVVAALGPGLLAQQRGRGQGGPPPTAQAQAPVDLTGYWVSVVTEDWRFRMVTPPKGDYASVPLNAEGRRVADTWDPSKDGRCEAYGAAAIMRMPGRLHITWEDDNTLKIDTDAGQQTRLLRFGPSTLRDQGRPEPGRGTTGAGSPSAERTLQGVSVAQWIAGGGRGPIGGFGGFGGNVAAPGAGARGGQSPAAAPVPGGGRAAPAPPPGGPGAGAPQRWGLLKVVTTQLKPGWLRKNGAPYSENAVVTENFIRFADGSDQWFTVSTIVEDPTYLDQTFITSTNFKREADGAKFKPVACRAT